MKITDYELLDHGLEYSQYFQGCGISITSYNHIVTGCGMNPSAAIDDALEQIAMSFDVDVEDLDKQMLAYNNLTAWPETPEAENEEDSEQYYYVSIRFNVKD